MPYKMYLYLMRRVFIILSSVLGLALGLVTAQSPDQTAPSPDAGAGSGQTVLKGAGELEASSQALLRERFEGWTLEWVANVRTKQILYSIVYGVRDPLSAMILTSTDLLSGT